MVAMKTLIFDFDGTLADSFETLLSVFDEVVNRPQKLTDQEIKNLRGMSVKQAIKHLKIKSWQIPRLLLRAKKLLVSKINDIKTFPDIPIAVKQLHQDGYRMFILSTNSEVNISKFLQANNLDGYFTKVYGDIGLRSKSSALKKIIKKERLSFQECVYIGDEVRDIEAARKAKIISVGVTWGFNNPKVIEQARPTYLAKTPTDLTKYLTS